ncbi:MAG: hypothetical protein HKO66_10965 [Saprospiraceae bacterium]|nr:hypothetical protein [Bacteroidia bacterium]NNL92746.1 hypothetical protein [Saprospiraceae bacterium]
MDTLQSLIKLLSKQKLKQIEIITEDVKLSPKTKMLYEGIRDNLFENDNDAAEKIYGPNPSKSGYKKLKYRLTQRLINTLFFIDVQAYSKSEYQKALNRSLKNWAGAKILQDKGLAKLSTELYEQILKSSLKYDIVELSLLILKDLKYYFGILAYNKYKYEKYVNQYIEVKHLYNLKEKAEDLFVRLGQLVTNSKSYIYDEKVKALEFETEVLLKEVNNVDSFYIRHYTYNAAYFAYLIKGDIDAQIDICKKAISYFLEKPSFKKIGIFAFRQKAGISYLAKKDYQKSYEYLTECMNFNLQEGTLSWMYVRNYYFQLHILRKDYQSAYKLISETINSKSFNKINEKYREPWHLKEAFIHFLIKTGKIDPDKSNVKKLRPFRLGRFMNEVPVFTKDKRGLNITINIIQMIFLIVEDRFDEVLDKLSSLRQYNFRYLKRPEYARSSNFIKMLIKIPEGNYNPKEIRAKASKYHKALLENPSDYSEHALSIEIIPYEQLWEEIMSIF